MIWRETAREGLKLLRFQFENHGARHTAFLARGGPELFRQAPDHWFGFSEQHILGKSILDRDGLGGPVGNNRVLVDSSGKFVEAYTVAAELILQFGSLQ